MSAPAEYKQVTVLFADVVHSMALAAVVGAERLREIMAAVFNRSSAVVRRYGGTVDKFTGDGLMAVFGAPVALEDHALRGCMAALGIQQEVRRLGAEMQAGDGAALQLRVGLNSGQVIAGEIGSGPMSYTAIGEQVGMAQRMESVAPPGGVMLGESTARLVEGSTVLSEPETVRIKGTESPVIAHRLLAIGAGDQTRARRLSTLVGRDWELTTVVGMLDQSVNGRGRIVGLVGPPGIGKSRMVGEIASRAADRDVDVFVARCESHTSEIPFHTAAGLLRGVFALGGLDDGASRGLVRARLPNADPEDLVLLEDLLGIRDNSVPLPDIDPDARRRRLAALLSASAAARTTPSVFVIEDAHWIDQVSEAMIADFAAVVPPTRTLMVVTYRPEYRGALDRLPGSHRIALATLNDSESTALTAELLGADSSVAELVGQIAERAAGNPFFAEEIVRDLAEQGVVQGEPGAYVCRAGVADLRVPASLQATIAARIDRLNSLAKRTLTAAAVIGSQFDADLLACLLDEYELTELIAAELIDQVTFTPQGAYEFRHPLIRTVAYESLLKSVRAELHRRLAAAIEEATPEEGDANAAPIAQHLEAAGDLRAAFDWHMRAGTWAQFRDIRAAQASWRRARDVADRIPDDDPGAAALRIAPRAALCISTWRVSGSVEDTGFDELRDLCVSAGDTVSLGVAMAGKLTAMIFHYQYRDAALLASECSRVLESIDDQTLVPSLYGAASNATFQAGHVEDGLHLAERAIELAGGDPTKDTTVVGSPLSLAYALRGVNRLCLGRAGWREDLEHGARMGRSAEPTSHAAAVLYKCGFAIHNGALVPDPIALAQTAHALAIADRFGDDFSLDTARLTHGIALVNGDNDGRTEGFALLEQYREASVRHGYVAKIVRFVGTEVAKEKARRGDVDGAIELGRQVVDLLFANGEMISRGPAVTVLVESLLRRGDQSDNTEAAAAVERLAAVPTDPGFVLHELPLLRLRALLAQTNGDADTYRGFRDRYRAMAESLGFEGHIATARAMP